MMKKYKAVLIPAICLVETIVLLNVILLFGYVPSASMEPTLKEGSIIVGCRLYRELKKGDIIIFEHDGVMHVKRISASPGETIEHNGPLLTVPAYSYYMLGDNADNSHDSRYRDDPFIFEDQVKAIVLMY